MKRVELILIDQSLFLILNSGLSLKSVLFKHFLFNLDFVQKIKYNIC